MKYDLCVIGLGYIGLPTASIFATRGKKVFGVDVQKHVVETINKGKIHIVEPDLDVLVRAAVQSGNLVAGLDPVPADTFIIAVPTPFTVTPENPRKPDVTYVENAARRIAPHVRPGNLVVLESTSPVGTTAKVREWILDEWKTLASASASAANSARLSEDWIAKVSFAYCPERVLPGQILHELVSNDRISGGLTPEAAVAAQTLYKSFCNAEIFLTNAATAEMAKLTENSFRDVNIAFANELSLICDRLKINVWELIRLANRHPRVKILQPGPGVGGHCIAVDPWFIVDSAPAEARLIRTAREVNDSKPHFVVHKIQERADRFKSPVIACLGLAFKADIDDLRESPSVEIVHDLATKKVGRLLVVEPYIKKLPASLAGLDNLQLTDTASALAAADIIVVLVNHREFSQVDRKLLSEKIVIDTRGIWS